MNFSIRQIPSWGYMVLLALYIFSLFYNLDLPALSLEEPRRTLVALEMNFNNNYILTSLLNEIWYDHPPLYNIVIALSVKLFGHNIFALRFPSALSLLFTGILLYNINKKYVSSSFGLLSAFYYLICVDLYFFFSLIAEIDIFYALLVFCSIISIFHFYQQKRFYLLFGISYFFITLAFFTKGFASYAFIGITLLTYFWHKKDFKRLFSIPHILSILFSFGCIALHLYYYHQHTNVWGYLEQMWELTSRRTLAGNHISKLFTHIFTYPLNFMGILFPSTLFAFFLFKKSTRKQIKQHPLIWFLVLSFALNFIVYLISPGARIRYSYMFIPIAITILVYGWYSEKNNFPSFNKWYIGLFQVLMAIFILALMTIPFINYFSIIPSAMYKASLLGLSFAALLFLSFKTEGILPGHIMVILFLILTRISYAAIALPIKAKVSSTVTQKVQAEEIQAITNGEKIYVLSNDGFNDYTDIPFCFYRTAAYLELFGEQALIKKRAFDSKGYYIMNAEKIKSSLLKPLYTFTIEKKNLVLVKKE